MSLAYAVLEISRNHLRVPVGWSWHHPVDGTELTEVQAHRLAADLATRPGDPDTTSEYRVLRFEYAPAPIGAPQ